MNYYVNSFHIQNIFVNLEFSDSEKTPSCFKKILNTKSDDSVFHFFSNFVNI